MPRLLSVMAAWPVWSMHHRPSMKATRFTHMLLAKAVIYKEVWTLVIIMGAKNC